MGYGEKIRLGEDFDNDSTLDTNIVKSDLINSAGKTVEIQISVTGDSLDSDNVEVYQFIDFNTEGYLTGTIALNGDNTVRKSFFPKEVKSFRVGLKMVDGSSETPNYKGSYSIRS